MSTNKIRNNYFSLSNEEYTESNEYNIKKLISILEKDRLVIVTGMKNIGKLNFIKDFIHKTNISNNYYYFNKYDDRNNYINSNLDLLNSLNDYIQLYKIPKIIILQNTSKINGIKDFIAYLYKLKYKVILLGNDITISGIKEVEITNSPVINIEDINLSLQYGSLKEINQLESEKLVKKILQLTTSDIFLNDIFKAFSVKSINLYYYTITFLAENSIFISLRELQKQLNIINTISLKTTIDYVDFSIQSKIIKRLYIFDIKKDKKITSKAKYYFTDNGIRNSLVNFNIKKDILIENLIFNILQYNNFKVYGGLNGKFSFTFYGKKETKEVFIHISRQNTKEKIKKEVKKLLKIGKKGNKFLLVDSIEKLGIKKTTYESVTIIETLEFIKNSKQK